jgi:hypothetical protein
VVNRAHSLDHPELEFPGLRAVGCTQAEIGAITGHLNAEVTAILGRRYAAAESVLARSAIAELEGITKPPDRAGESDPGRENGA